MWRYLQELSSLGIALYSEPGTNGGYRILVLDDDKNEVEVIYKPRTAYIGYSFDSPYIAKQETEILAPRLWIQLLARIKEIQTVKYPMQKTALGHYRNEDFTYFITVAAEEVKHIPKGMTAISIPDMYYARKTHGIQLELKNVIQTYEDIYKWIEQSEWSRAEEGFSLEIYGEQYKPHSKEANFDIFIPIRK